MIVGIAAKASVTNGFGNIGISGEVKPGLDEAIDKAVDAIEEIVVEVIVVEVIVVEVIVK
ncbi:MAG: hypothetical protein D6680_17885 [Cyanobacteria bacterium J007]|nr:MAG: hypothetical protein D6680_17885 [Cyanobacteria bacterium J007]